MRSEGLSGGSDRGVAYTDPRVSGIQQSQSERSSCGLDQSIYGRSEGKAETSRNEEVRSGLKSATWIECNGWRVLWTTFGLSIALLVFCGGSPIRWFTLAIVLGYGAQIWVSWRYVLGAAIVVAGVYGGLVLVDRDLAGQLALHWFAIGLSAIAMLGRKLKNLERWME